MVNIYHTGQNGRLVWEVPLYLALNFRKKLLDWVDINDFIWLSLGLLRDFSYTGTLETKDFSELERNITFYVDFSVLDVQGLSFFNSGVFVECLNGF